MTYRHLIALTAILTHTAFGALSAPMPAFKTASQLATWRAEMAAKPTSHGDSAEDPAFFTGKPYIDASGGYAFKYRSYNPELARWTSEDPSGFPDGANNLIYINNCVLSALDPLGLATQWISGTYTITATWTERLTNASELSFSVNLPLGITVTVTPKSAWEKIGQITSPKTAGEYAEKATAPSGWTWCDAVNTIRNPTTASAQDGAASYGSITSVWQSSYQEYSFFSGTLTTVQVYQDQKVGTLSATYTWERMA